MYTFVFFDLDGTLTDSKEGVMNCARHAIAALGDVPPGDEILVKFVGPPLQESFRQFCGYSEEKCALAIRLFRERYAPVGQFENRPAPGIRELLERLRQRGVRTALASTKPESLCVEICGRFGFSPFLEVIAGSPESGDTTKSAVLRSAMDRLGAGPGDLDRCLMVGDRKFDVEGARACGMDCVGVEFFGCAEPGELERAGALTVVRTVEELEHFLFSGGE